MGRATRWLKGLFGIKVDKEHKQNSNSRSLKSMMKNASHSESNSKVLCHNPATIPPNISPSEPAWLRTLYTENEKEQNKHAIAVAAATAAAADAAVAAAHAAVAVVRLTSNGRGTMFGGRHEICAVVKIQTMFRGYLARKALRALKGLAKLQALVRGYLVRKQATATLHSMQALIRAQATVRYQKSHRLMSSKNEAYRIQNDARRSMERFDDTRSEYVTGPIHSRKLSSCFDATINNRNNSVDMIGSPREVEMDTRSVDWGLTGEEYYRFSTTAQSTPRFTHSCTCDSVRPMTPKSVCNDNLLLREHGNFPSYMGSTQSFKAKLRSHSAPKQRPQPCPKKRLSLHEMMESRSSLSGVRMQRSCPQMQEVTNFKNAVMSRLHKSTESSRETDRYYFHQRR